MCIYVCTAAIQIANFKFGNISLWWIFHQILLYIFFCFFAKLLCLPKYPFVTVTFYGHWEEKKLNYLMIQIYILSLYILLSCSTAWSCWTQPTHGGWRRRMCDLGTNIQNNFRL